MIKHQTANSEGNFNSNTALYHGQEWYSHFHKNLELVTVTKGVLHAFVGDDEYTMEKGEWALILSNQVHAFSCDKDCQYWIMVFSEDHVPLFAEKIRGQQGNTAVFKCDEAVSGMVKNHLMSGEASLYMKKACLYAVCDCYLNSVTLETRKFKTDFAVGKVLDYISLNFAENISLKTCAALLGYEYHYLSRLLEKGYNINFRKLLNQYRIDEALELLRTTQIPVTEIAFKCGFQSIRSFNAIIKNDVGISPTAYRKINR